ncbi:MAG TPA: outer membrane lipoprotein-sorting protein [Candidatus Saccharimonadia bacterium]|nr:outer membrane lipoprotein-sorting protein [Candidatus Saccharimonadia bacterium]
MKARFPLSSRLTLLGAALAALAFYPEPAHAQESGGMTAKDLASKLSAQQQDGNSFIRLKMDTAGSPSLQVQIKSRKSASSTEVVYQILFPKEQKGNGVLLRSSGGGAVFTAPDKLATLESSQMKQAIFNSALTYEDVVQNFFAWDSQAFAGTETINKVECHILESKGGKGSSYAKVRSWIDLRRMVPMRVEKYSSGGDVVVRIDTVDVVSNDGKHIPATLSVRRGSTVTELDGSRIKRGVSYTDADFSPEGLKNVSAPRGGD